VLIAFVALAVARGGGVAGIQARGLPAASAAAVGVVLVQVVFAAAGPISDPVSPAGLLGALLAFGIIQTVATGLALLLGRPRTELLGQPAARTIAPLLLESANAPLAWLLAFVIQSGSWLQAAAITVLTLLALASSIRFDRTLVELRESNSALSSRLVELATLNDIGRQIVSSMERERVFSILERECRRIFLVDACFVALVDRDTLLLHPAYRRSRGSAPTVGGAPVRCGIASWVLETKSSRRIDDLRQLPAASPVHGDLIEADSRSVMAVPLIVEDHVVGVLGVQSRQPAAYDDHRLSVLATIAQQTAVAIENARNFQMATVDSLTGFFLRDFFFQRLSEEDRRVRRYGGVFALLMIDLDGFKEINDANGHLAGDRYLSQVAATIGEQLRAADLACRYGGDEFCLLLPQTDRSGARIIAERIRRAVAERTVGVDGVALKSTVSIGIAVFPEHDAGDLHGLVRNADEALYRAKRAGRDRVVPYAA
jgi:diguanylate cyclase (GGDEF)-like protein